MGGGRRGGVRSRHILDSDEQPGWNVKAKLFLVAGLVDLTASGKDARYCVCSRVWQKPLSSGQQLLVWKV